MAALPAFIGLIMLTIASGQKVDITPRDAVRRIGDELIVLCKVDYPIDSCRMTVGTTSYRLIPSNQDGGVVYSGQGLEFGECGAMIKHIKEEWNGNISCLLPPQTGNIEVMGTMRLLVAKPPGEPQLIAPRESAFKEGDELRAQCVVPDGRPVAKITWFLDEEQLLRGTHQPVITTAPNSDLQTISQNITLPLTAEEGGKKLTCQVEHEALQQPRVASQQLSVLYPPKRQEEGTITIFGLKLGEDGRLNVTVRANPPPAAQWRVGAGGSAGGAVQLDPVPLGSGYYNVSLLLPKITKEDVERKYYLQVSNELGAEEFTVLISTMDEPAGVELEAGAIVGIVIAVLVLLIAVSLAVFAKATDRWCFGGRSHRTDMPDGADSEAPLPPQDDVKGSENPSHDHGEYITNGKHHEKKPDTAVTPAGDVLLESGMTLPKTSDTESAVAGRERSRLAGLGARMRAVLPRGKDKVQATETQAAEAEEKPLSEEKKGVVYAELQLGTDAGTDKPPPPSTEYAEIVYTDQPPKENKE